MHNILKTLIVTAILSVCGIALGENRRVLTMDAVELLAGREAKGDPAHSLVRDGYTYQFANNANKAAFAANPTKYEIQLGGACARMGPLSGEGRCELYAVHEGRLYIFASESCREGFLKASDKLLEADETPVKAEDAARQRGAELIELAYSAHGGPAIDAVKIYRQRIDATREYNGKKAANNRALTIQFPDTIRDDYTWDTSRWTHVMSAGRGAWLTEKGYDKAMADQQCRAFGRQLSRNLLAILKSRKDANFVAARVGNGEIKGTPVEHVTVSLGGANTTLSIDPKSGKILATASVGRGGDRGYLGTAERIYAEWKTVDNVLLPWSWTTRFDGKDSDDPATTLTSIEINPKLEADELAVPRE